MEYYELIKTHEDSRRTKSKSSKNNITARHAITESKSCQKHQESSVSLKTKFNWHKKLSTMSQEYLYSK